MLAVPTDEVVSAGWVPHKQPLSSVNDVCAIVRRSLEAIEDIWMSGVVNDTYVAPVLKGVEVNDLDIRFPLIAHAAAKLYYSVF